MSENLHLSDSMLVQYVDGDLTAEQAAWLASHLESCAECRAAMSAFTGMDGELTAWGQNLERQNPPPAGAREILAARLGPFATPRRTGRWRPAAGVAIAAGLALLIFAPRTVPPPATRASGRFIAIPYVPPLDPHENTAIVRMDIRVATLMSVGYKMTADPDAIVQADVLVGEDGRAHAVRILSDFDWNGTGD